MKNSSKKTVLIPRTMLISFVLVTCLFALWGFANDITNPLVKAFEEIFLINSKQGGLVQTAFYGGYATMAIPAAIFIRKFSYKSGLCVGLTLYAIGALLFIPASIAMQFWLFLFALYILTFGLAFLETTANPYILSMGDPATATRRLNFAQAFNPIGSLMGMFVARNYILSDLRMPGFIEAQTAAHPEYAKLASGEVNVSIKETISSFTQAQLDSFNAIQLHDLATVRLPYVVLACVVICFLITFLIKKMPQTKADSEHDLRLKAVFLRLIHNKPYLFGVFAQMFYVGAQIMCWTYIIHYAVENFDMTLAEAQGYNIIAMVIFCCSRFICTALLRFFNSSILLTVFAIAAMALVINVMISTDIYGLYSLIGVSACMSLMFPTIYGIALDGLGEDSKLASAGLIFAIVGGALMPPMQGSIIDMGGFLGMSGVNSSFILPLICFALIALYGAIVFKINSNKRTA